MREVSKVVDRDIREIATYRGELEIDFIDHFGFLPSMTREKLEEWIEVGVFRTVGSFEDFVNEQWAVYARYRPYLSMEDESAYGVGLFARALVWLYGKYEVSDAGEDSGEGITYRCKNRTFYNGNVFIPQYVEDEVLYGYGSSFFTRYSFISEFEGERVNDSEYLVSYRESLEAFDESVVASRARVFGLKNVSREKRIEKYWREVKSFPLAVIGMSMRTNRGYVSVVRGVDVEDASKVSLPLTGVVEGVTFEETMEAELGEEFGIGFGQLDTEMFTLSGYGFVESGDAGTSASLFYVNVKLWIEFEELVERQRAASDAYENAELVEIEGTRSSYVGYVSNLNCAGSLKGYLDLATRVSKKKAFG